MCGYNIEQSLLKCIFLMIINNSSSIFKRCMAQANYLYQILNPDLIKYFYLFSTFLGYFSVF